ncbi:MAG: AMP-binding protein, partial [Acidobacteriota bacterium]|nr:AMP-binding protein [Acidobacteriota bacterium]
PLSSIHSHSFPSMRYITNSGGAVSGKLLSAMQKAFPSVEIYLMYGLTEAFRSTFLPPSELNERPRSIGKAIPETEIFVLREDGEPCDPGEPGELVHRGPTVSLGYWNNVGATSEVIRQNPLALPEISTPEMVCYSGDIVVADEDGYLTFVGRRDATIKSSGYRISPTEVEEILIGIVGVNQAAAVGVEDELLGQSIHVFVVPENGTTIDCDDLLASCADEMPSYMIPKRINVVDSLPTTSTGKVDYPGLRSRASEMENQGGAL